MIVNTEESIKFCLKEINSLRGNWSEAAIQKTIMTHNVMEEAKRRIEE